MNVEIAFTALASKAVSILAPYVSKGATDLTKMVGEVGYAKARQLFETVKERLTGDQEASETLDKFEKAPEENSAATEAVLAKTLAKDDSFAGTVDSLIKEIGPQVTVFQDIRAGKNVIGVEAGRLNRGRVGVNQKMDTAENVTGAKINEIG
jgi:hypothetical protein